MPKLTAAQKAALAELKRRGHGINLLGAAFPAQQAFIQDTSRLKAALCTRRAGKSMGAGLYLIDEAMKRPGTTCLYIALTRDSAQRIMFKDVLKVLNTKFQLGMHFNHTSLAVTLPNGSVIYLVGADSSESEREKVLGQKFSLVVIDEAASFRQDLRELVYKVIRPATADYQGTICLIGTPSNITKSLFYDITMGMEAGWSVHTWTALDNPHMTEEWKSEIAQLKESNPDIEYQAWFQQMYMGKWAINEDARVYRFNKDINVEYKPIPEDLTYILSVDLGYSPDDTAFVVGGYNSKSPNLYIVEAFKLPKLIISDVAVQILALQERYAPQQIICDSISANATEELRQRYNIPLQRPVKFKKLDYIQLMNGDFVTGKIKIWHECTPLIEEYASIVYDERSTIPAIHPSSPDHCADATLYIWRVAKNYVYQPVHDTRVDRHSEEAVERWWEKQADKLTKVADRSFLENDWFGEFDPSLTS